MGNRLSKIYTRTGDNGTTGLGDGARVPKDHARIEALGAVDELNSAIGVALTHAMPDTMREILTSVQHELFDLGGELCIPNSCTIADQHVARLERILDQLNQDLPPLREFILPGGSPAAAACHAARTVCRRAERRITTLARAEPINPVGASYLNRLSDLLFVMARAMNALAGVTDTLWRHERP
ncbi:MAG: cob(I)yrinic acid a,c-diamide adenosyltransferase [Pseudomonadota bacterium]|nr:MAG: cob(I)yrinic acid a,c-diamide adenosyltransferase [Pseudomonadota bacterium]